MRIPPQAARRIPQGALMSPQDRPTFDESWYRVVDLRPRLHPAVRTYRQEYRGRIWHVVHDPANNQCFRVSAPAYHLVGLLDGKRSVAEAWRIVNDHLGDDAPTQGETIQLLGQLYTANLLHSEIPADAASMFERYRKRVRREIGGYAMNILFPRIPLFDPDHMLNRWIGVVGWIFSGVGLVLWLSLIAVGFYHVAGRWNDLMLAADPQSLLATENIVLLYLCFAGIKAIHELGHAFAAKHFGQQNQSGGEVHVIGIMFLVLMPVPYVDASIAWTFRNKWHRAVVGLAGMYVELAVASIAAVVWARTGSATLVHDIAYNLMFIASVSTLLFNANPLLRYDGYYILSDLLEMPNLAQNSKQYLYHLVKRYVFGYRDSRSPVDLPGEKAWCVVYGICSGIYRVFISVAILLYIAGKLFFIGILLALAGLTAYAVVPVGKFIKYLATSHELNRVRSRAALATLGFIALLIIALGVIPRPDYQRAVGVVAPRKQFTLYAKEAGFVNHILPSGSHVPAGEVLLAADDPDLGYTLTSLEAQQRQTQAELRLAETRDPAEAKIKSERLAVIARQIARAKQRLDDLRVRSPAPGIWIAPDIDTLNHSYVQQGKPIGIIAPMDDLIVRVVADQTLGPRLADELVSDTALQMRLRHLPDTQFAGKVDRIFPAGGKELPSPALAVTAGGPLRIDPNEREPLQAAEPFFEIDIKPDAVAANATHLPGLLPGQRVEVRFQLTSKPLAWQWWRALRQMFQQRFQF